MSLATSGSDLQENVRLFGIDVQKRDGGLKQVTRHSIIDALFCPVWLLFLLRSVPGRVTIQA